MISTVVLESVVVDVLYCDDIVVDISDRHIVSHASQLDLNFSAEG